MKSGNIFLGVLAGFATGAAVGILFAPKKGSKTRQLIVDKSEDYAEAVKDKIDTLLEDINEQCVTFFHDAEKMVSKGKNRLNGVATETKEALV